MQHYDYIMAGGGMAALSLSYQIVSWRPDASILIVDPQRKGENDRTWSYWAASPQPFDEIASTSWRSVRLDGHGWSTSIDIAPYVYRMIRSVDFYDAVLSRLEDAPNVAFHRADVVTVEDGAESALIECGDGSTWVGDWVFDSRFDPAEYAERTGPYHYLKQHFLGWTIEADAPVFDPDAITMFDFRTPHHDQMRFVYVLPSSTTRALVEFTLFSAALLDDDEYVSALSTYIGEVLGIGAYRVVERERGVIPMTDEHVPRHAGRRVLAIGTRGGRVKPSTGYAFRRTQADSLAIVASLRDAGHPFAVPATKPRFALLDTMMLQVMHRNGARCEDVFSRLFRKNPAGRLFRFLDEEVSLAEMLAVMATVPWAPFIRAFVRTRLLGKV